MPKLSPQQRIVATLIAKGYSGPQIARHLELSAHTVAVHRRLLMRKLGTRSLAGIVHYVIGQGWVRIGEVEQ